MLRALLLVVLSVAVCHRVIVLGYTRLQVL